MVRITDMTKGKARMMNDPHRKTLLKKQRTDGNEHLIALKNGKVIGRATSGRKSRATIPDHILKLIGDTEETIKIMHNHPSGGSFSDKDVKTFRDNPGLAELTAEGEKVSFSIRRTAKTGQIDMSEFARLRKSFMDILEPHVFHSNLARPWLHANLARKAILHALMRSLDKRGFVTYIAEGNLRAEERIIDDYHVRSPS